MKLIRVLAVLLGLTSVDVHAGQFVSVDMWGQPLTLSVIGTGWGQEGIYVYTKTAAQITLGGDVLHEYSHIFY